MNLTWNAKSCLLDVQIKKTEFVYVNEIHLRLATCR